MTRRIGFVLLALLALPAFADNTDVEETPDIRRYTVEMIIFRYAQEVSVGSEVFVPDEPPESESMELGLLPESEQTESSELLPDSDARPDEVSMNDDAPDAAQERRAFSLLLEEELTLANIFARMERLEVYEPLMHFGWTQSTLPEDETEARLLSSFAVPPAGLDGDLTLYLSRYLHLAVNLQLDAEVKRARTMPRERRLNFFGDDMVEPVTEQTTRYRIVENRIVRNGELRYFDHPKFGVLAKVSRVEEPDEEADDGDDELLGDIPQQVR